MTFIDTIFNIMIVLYSSNTQFLFFGHSISTGLHLDCVKLSTLANQLKFLLREKKILNDGIYFDFKKNSCIDDIIDDIRTMMAEIISFNPVFSNEKIDRVIPRSLYIKIIHNFEKLTDQLDSITEQNLPKMEKLRNYLRKIKKEVFDYPSIILDTANRISVQPDDKL